MIQLSIDRDLTFKEVIQVYVGNSKISDLVFLCLTSFLTFDFLTISDLCYLVLREVPVPVVDVFCSTSPTYNVGGLEGSPNFLNQRTDDPHNGRLLGEILNRNRLFSVEKVPERRT